MTEIHYDYIVIGSGFGGSVAAMRLSEKGYKVLVLEKGKRWDASDFPKSNWNLRKFLWFPFLRWFGLMQMTFFKKVFVLTGVGVGGGSLIYANTHMMPPDTFFEDPSWSGFKNWKSVLLPFYEKARFMLGSTRYVKEYFEDHVLRQVARDMGVEETYRHVDHVGVYFGHTEGDPYFNGLGPIRKPCIECAGCMVGCRHHAKNSLDKNYLWFAEKYFGAKIMPETKAFKIVHKADGTYEVQTRSATKWFSDGKVFKSKGIVLSAGVLGTLDLLLRQKYQYNTLTNVSSTVGEQVLTNSEMISGVSVLDQKMNHGIAISAMFNPDKNTFVEICKYPDGSGSMYRLAGPAASGGARWRRIRNLISHFVRKPHTHLKVFFNRDLAHHSIIFLIMQSLPYRLCMKLRKTFWGGRLALEDPGKHKIHEFINIGQEAMLNYASKANGIPQNALTEVFFGMATTAHILGGCKMGNDVEEGVIDDRMRLHGYPNFYILDGSMIQANPGVNPSLSITALSEYAMSLVDAKPGHILSSFDDLMKQQNAN